jgi:MBG domain (YGX type)
MRFANACGPKEGVSMDFRHWRSALWNAALLVTVVLLTAVVVRAQSSCAAGQTCTATFDGQVYTIIGPCDLSSISTISGCLVVGIAPVTIPPPPSCPQGDLFLCQAASIVQDPNAPTQALEEEAKANIASLRVIPNDTLNDFWSRGQILAYMYLRVLGMANSSTLSSQDQSVVNYYTNAINTERVNIANEALSLYNQWQGNPCGFQVPVGDPNVYINEQFGTILSPGPCALAQIPNSPACLFGGCIPPPPSAQEFTDWATGVILEGQVNGWGQLLYSESGVVFPSTTTPSATPLQVAQLIAQVEYDRSFAGVAEGVEYLTAKHASIANVSSSTETAVESDLQEAWLDGLHDVAGDQFRDVVINSLVAVFKGGATAGSVDTLAENLGVVGQADLKLGNTLEELGLSSEDTEFPNTTATLAEDAAAQSVEEDLVAEAGEVAGETWDSVVGPAIAGAAIIAFETWQQIQNASVLTDLQTSLCNATGGKQDSSACSATSPESLNSYAQDPTGRQTILTAVIESALPNFSTERGSSSFGFAPSAGPTTSADPSFRQNGGTPTGSFGSQDWDGTQDATSVANGWFVQSATTNVGQSYLAYVPSLSYLTPSVQCTTTSTGQNCTAINPEGWRAWLDGDQLLAQREFVVVGSGTVQDATNTCPSTLLPQGNTDLGNVCVIGSFPFAIQQNDEVSIGGQVRQVAAVTSSSGTVTSFQTTKPFDNDSSGNLPSGQVVVLTNTDGNCLTSSSMGSRVSGPDCTEGSTISTSEGVVTIVPPAKVNFSLSTLAAKTYGDPSFNVASFANSDSSGGFTFSLASGSVGCAVDAVGNVTITGAGTCMLNVSEAAAGNFGASVTNVASFTIAPAPLQITASSPTITYGTAPTITPSYSGFVNNDSPSSLQNAPVCSTTATASSPVSTYPTSCAAPPLPGGGIICTGPIGGPLTCTSSLPISANYTPSFVGGTLTIQQAPLQITASSPTIPYGSAIPAITASYSGLITGDSADSLTTKPTCSTTAVDAVGKYPSSCTGAVDANYSISYTGGYVTVSPAMLIITPNNVTKILDAANPALNNVSYNAFVNGDSAASLGGTLTCTTTATTTSAVGSYPITCNGQTSSNYTIMYTPGTLKILYASSGLCDGQAGHQILPPLSAAGTSVFKPGRTVPIQFRVCNANGVSVGSAGVVANFALVQTIAGTAATADQAVSNTTANAGFQFDPSALEWVLNLSTKNQAAGFTYVYLITLNDGTTIPFQFGLN